MAERQTAYLTTIGTVLGGSFVKSEAQMQPSYVKTADGQELSRIHFIAVVVSLDHHEAVLDDGTGKIIARHFENPEFFSLFHLGDIIRIIGRVRAFNEQLYLVPEIAKKITNKQFIALHKLLLQQQHQEFTPAPVSEITEEQHEEVPIDDIQDTAPGPVDRIIAYIKAKDTGEGVLIEEIANEVEHTDKLIKNLLESGDLFEMRPGRVKVLE
jgi:hypothetical protein